MIKQMNKKQLLIGGVAAAVLVLGGAQWARFVLLAHVSVQSLGVEIALVAKQTERVAAVAAARAPGAAERLVQRRALLLVEADAVGEREERLRGGAHEARVGARGELNVHAHGAAAPRQRGGDGGEARRARRRRQRLEHVQARHDEHVDGRRGGRVGRARRRRLH
jgi:hypothetical protein